MHKNVNLKGFMKERFINNAIFACPEILKNLKVNASKKRQTLPISCVQILDLLNQVKNVKINEKCGRN